MNGSKLPPPLPTPDITKGGGGGCATLVAWLMVLVIAALLIFLGGIPLGAGLALGLRLMGAI